MTVPRLYHFKTDSIRVKNKIILALKPSTKLLHTNKKISININKIRKSTTYFYNKIHINSILTLLKIQTVLANQYKVHSTLV